MGNLAWCDRRAAKPEDKDNMQIIIPSPETFAFKISAVQGILTVPNIALMDDNIDKVYVKQSQTQSLFQFNIIPIGYHISTGKTYSTIILFPKKEFDQILKFDIYCYSLTFSKLRAAINTIADLICQKRIHQYHVYKSDFDINTEITDWKDLWLDQNLKRLNGHKKNQVQVDRNQVLILDVIFKKQQHFQIPEEAYESFEQQEPIAKPKPKPGLSLRQRMQGSNQLEMRKNAKNFTFNLGASFIRKHAEDVLKTSTLELITRSSDLPQLSRRRKSFVSCSTIEERLENLVHESEVSQLPNLNREVSRLPSDPVSKRYITKFGNTSYCSAVIQALTHVKRLTEYFMFQNWKETLTQNSFEIDEPTLTDEYFNILAKLIMPDSDPVSLEPFHATLCGFDKTYKSYDLMQDAAVCLNEILQEMHNELNVMLPPESNRSESRQLSGNRIAEEVAQSAQTTWKYYTDYHNSQIVQNFQGMIQISQLCHGCHTIVQSYEIFQQIVLIPKIKRHQSSIPLAHMLASYTKSREMSDQYWLECRQHWNARVIHELYYLPPVLIIQIKRFSDDNANTKCEVPVIYPKKKLDIQQYIWHESDWESGLYDLKAVVCHSGGFNSGRCYTHGRRNRHEWYSFHDDGIRKIKDSKVVDDQAYLLIYELRNN